MLLEEFDENKNALFNPSTFHSVLEEMPRTCLSFFSKSIMDEIVKNCAVEQIASIKNSTTTFPVYKLNVNGTELVIYQSAVGAPACVSNYEELIAMGIKNFLLVGSCGCLDDKINEYSIIIPTSAIRDEGTSYHYAPVSDETKIDENIVVILEETIKNLSLNYVKGKTWTTDAIFRETVDKIKKRKQQGAITVDMECSAMNIVSKFRNVNFGQIFYGADSLASEEYDPRTFINGNFDEKKKIISIAFECALAMDKKLK